MKVVGEIEIMGRWEIAIETTNEQEQKFLEEKIKEIGAEFMESGVSEIVVYANGSQKLKLINFVSNNEKI